MISLLKKFFGLGKLIKTELENQNFTTERTIQKPDHIVDEILVKNDVEEERKSGIIKIDIPKKIPPIKISYDPSLDLKNYKYPTLDLLELCGDEIDVKNLTELELNKEQIIKTFNLFNIEIQKITVSVGPTFTLYEIIPALGIRISMIKKLENDIALSLAVSALNISPILAKGTIGIEVPNQTRKILRIGTILSSDKFHNNTYSLPIALGKTMDNRNFIFDLVEMPHLLISGATGQGKSIALNIILISLLFKKHPSQFKDNFD